MVRNEYQNRDNYYDRVFEPVIDEIIEKHLLGEITIAIFPTDIQTQTVKFCCWDIDSELQIDLDKVKAVCSRLGFKYVVECSGRETRFHVWHFFDEPQPIWKIREIEHECNTFKIDFFPDRDVVLNDFFCELPIKLPLGYHRKDGVWSHFIDNNFNKISFEQALMIAGYSVEQ